TSSMGAARRDHCRVGAARSGWRALAADARQPPSLLTGTPRPTAGQGGPVGGLGLQLTAFFTSAPILASSTAVGSVRANSVGHMVSSPRFVMSLKPSVAYVVLNL